MANFVPDRKRIAELQEKNKERRQKLEDAKRQLQISQFSSRDVIHVISPILTTFEEN